MWPTISRAKALWADERRTSAASHPHHHVMMDRAEPSPRDEARQALLPLSPPGELSSQEAAGEQDRANGDCRHHRADDAEPLLVGRRIRNSAVQPIAHRIPRLTSAVVPSPVPANGCAGRCWRQLWSIGRAREKAAQCSFSVTAIRRAAQLAPPDKESWPGLSLLSASLLQF